MSIISKIIAKRKTKTKTIPTVNYNNPKADGSYRICMHCDTMFPISNELSRAALCWHCYLKVLRSGHYLTNHLTPSEFEHYPDKPVVVFKEKTIKSSPFGGAVCSCGEEFERKTSRQKRCDKCVKDSARLYASARQRKHSRSS